MQEIAVERQARSADSNFLIERNARHVWHPMIDPKESEKEPPLIVAEADGVYITDIDGNRLLDCSAGLWNVNVGHNRPEIKKAIIDQLNRIAYYATFNITSNAPSITLSARLTELLAPEEMVKVMFSSGGSDAVETALKLARQYWKLEGQGAKTKIISLKNGYHGVHFGGMAAGGNPLWRLAYEPMTPGFYQVECPYLYRNPFTDNHEELGEICARMLEREIENQGPATVAAFIAEPVQGAGGVIVPPSNFWPRLREVCDRYDILLIADEVVTGFGRTGTMFGSRHWGVKPDIMCFAKGINSGYVPLGATAVNARVADAWQRDHPLAAIMHGYTYAGHPLACAAAIANLDIVEKEDLPGNAGTQGGYFLDGLEQLRDRFDAIGDIRGCGLMIGVELVRDRATRQPFAMNDTYCRQIQQIARDQGVMFRIQGNKLIISPPLVFRREHVDEALAAVATAFEQAKL